jgi:F-type H+-transporting ATPase subunit b
MSGRAERIRDDIESARLNKEQAIGVKADYESMMEKIDKEREKILSEARLAAVKKSDQILFDAQEEAKYMIARAHDEIKLERDNAADEIKMKIIEISNLIASRFIEVSVDRQIQDNYIDEALADWSEQV